MKIVRLPIMLAGALVFQIGFTAMTPFAYASAAAREVVLKKSADALLRNGRSERAILLYKKVLEKDPSLEAAYFNLAIAFYSEHRIDEARLALKKLLRLNPHDGEAWYNLGCLTLYRCDIKTAKCFFEKAKKECGPDCCFTPLVDSGLLFSSRLEGLDPASRKAVITLFLKHIGLSL